VKSKGPVRDVEKERKWRKVIGEQRRSGLSIRQYCRQHGLREPSFYAWRGELKRRREARCEKFSESRSTAFVPIRVASGDASLPSLASIELALPGGAVLRLPSSMEPAAVAAIVIAWEQGRC
jgi:hypothetical protein